MTIHNSEMKILYTLERFLVQKIYSAINTLRTLFLLNHALKLGALNEE